MIVLHLANRRKADARGVIIADRVKENILGYFTQRHKERTSSTSRKDLKAELGIISLWCFVVKFNLVQRLKGPESFRGPFGKNFKSTRLKI
jgi:hypothetical protein